MSDDKTARKMTSKGFVHKAKIAKSAIAFLAQYREYMTTGELAPICSPIVAQVDAGNVLPTPALNEIINVVFAHNLAKDIAEGEAKMARANEPKKEYPYEATIYDEAGQVATRVVEEGERKLLVDDEGEIIGAAPKQAGAVENLIKAFENHQRAAEWCDRRLFEGAAGWRGEVVAKRLFTKSGAPMTTQIERDDAIARILKRPKQPTMKRPKMSTDKLGFGVKVKQDTAKFSRG